MEISVELIKSPRQGSDQIAQSTFPHNKQDVRANENSLLPEGSGGAAALNTQGEDNWTQVRDVRVISVQADRGRDDRTETQNRSNQARQTLTYSGVFCSEIPPSQIQQPFFGEHAHNSCYSAAQHSMWDMWGVWWNAANIPSTADTQSRTCPQNILRRPNPDPCTSDCWSLAMCHHAKYPYSCWRKKHVKQPVSIVLCLFKGTFEKPALVKP